MPQLMEKICIARDEKVGVYVSSSTATPVGKMSRPVLIWGFRLKEWSFCSVAASKR
ncbi:hypothetical protein FS749_012376 [Ceratobasidium sp. UAMH 11750]|nr:hypothetical protein FS749_012376 [Ceratobasidium sp. UAMH 11750]